MRVQLSLLAFFFGALGLIALASRMPTRPPEVAAPMVEPRHATSAAPVAAKLSARETANHIEDESHYLDADG